MTVPNLFPSTSAGYRIAFVGEAPGKDEALAGKPFVGASGRLLNALLSKANILRESCFIGNVCQVQPPGNNIAVFEWDGDEIQKGISQLGADLQRYRPNLIVCLGATALHVLKEGNRPLKTRKTKDGPKFVYPNSIDSWRGSLFMSTAECSPIPPTKCLAAHHPAFCLRAYENTPLLMMDLNKAAKEGRTAELVLPERDLVAEPSFDDVMNTIDYYRRNRAPVAMDIEGYWTGMTCISVADSEKYSLTIPFARKDGSSYWGEEEEVLITRRLALLLADPAVPKIWQNGLYDRWVLQYGYRMPVFGNADDTMLKWWEKYCELSKGLDSQASILTSEPYYKGDRKSDDDLTHYRYCAKDSAVTYEINEKLTPLVSGRSLEHYRFNHSLLNLFLYIELRGIRYNTPLSKERLAEVNRHIYHLQAKLDKLCGLGLDPSLDAPAREALARSICCHKRDTSKPKKDFEDEWDTILATARKPTLSEDDHGYLSTLLGLSMNIKSPKFKTFLYGEAKGETDLLDSLIGDAPTLKGLGLPPQYNKDTGAVTTDALALLKLSKKHPHPVLDTAIEIGFLRTRSQMLAIHADPDGRIRCGYNAVGSETGRTTCYTSPTGSGYNLQTLPDDDNSKPNEHPLRKGMRDLVCADHGHYLFQCDLKGSDGWTIGAHLHRLGDSTMLDDLRFGIKPASRICYMLRHGVASLKGKDRGEVAELLKEIKKTDWDYFACKIGMWGICYLMGSDTLSDNLFEESDGKITLSRKEIGDFKTAVFEGYHVKLWHTWMARQLSKSPTITSASGHTRRFFGRPTEILGAALAHEPQSVTTYATNLAAYRLWMDPENRMERHVYDNRRSYIRVPLRIEPLHQVHDALIGQFPIEETEWAVSKIKSFFDNPLVIAGQQITIPFEGNYGPSWGEQKNPL